MPSSYNRSTGAVDSFTTGTLTGVVSGSDHGNKADAINKIEAQVIKEAPLNVKWPEFGAVGDGTTNDKAAIQAAIDIPTTHGHVEVHLPPGIYKLNSTLSWEEKCVRLIGAAGSNSLPFGNPGGTSLLVAASTTAIAIENGSAAGSGGRSSIQNLHILRQDTGATSAVGVLLRANSVRIDNVVAENFGSHGFYILSGTDADPFVEDAQNNANGWYLNGCRAYRNRGDGLRVWGIDSNVGCAINFMVTDNEGWGIYDNSGFGNVYVGPEFDGNEDGAIRLGVQTQGCRFYGVYKEGDSFPALQIDAAAAGNFVDFRVLLGGASETITDNSGTGDNQVLISGTGAMRQTRILIGDYADTNRLYLQPDGILFGNAGDTNVRRIGADVLGTDDDFAIATVGKGLRVKEGSNAKMGTATLVAGTVAVATTAVATGDRIFITPVNTGGTAGHLSYTISNGTSFTVTSSSGTDTRTFNWMIVRPA